MESYLKGKNDTFPFHEHQIDLSVDCDIAYNSVHQKSGILKIGF